MTFFLNGNVISIFGGGQDAPAMIPMITYVGKEIFGSVLTEDGKIASNGGPVCRVDEVRCEDSYGEGAGVIGLLKGKEVNKMN
jgi:hypothetical protein